VGSFEKDRSKNPSKPYRQNRVSCPSIKHKPPTALIQTPALIGFFDEAATASE
jgi:hypothetical protein